MPAPDQSFGTNNPFRRKTSPSSQPIAGPAAPASLFEAAVTEAATRPPLTTFKAATPDDERLAEDYAPVQTKPKKIVKRVRVQSPPPSSPEDSVPVTRLSPNQDDLGHDDDSSSDDSDDDGAARDPSGRDQTQPAATAIEPPLPRAPPPNPFQKTLQDMEQSAQSQDPASLTAAASSKGAMDVDAFKRLLLTGYANIPGSSPAIGGSSGPAAQPQPTSHDGASTTDASSVSRQSVFDTVQETPRTSHETSEPEDPDDRRNILPSSPLSTVQSASSRKPPPPPPSSRHGKLIKIELGAPLNPPVTKDTSPPLPPMPSDMALPSIPPFTSAHRTSSIHSQTSMSSIVSATSDLNKPLPLPPRSSPDDEPDSPFDREAAGKVPEPSVSNYMAPLPPAPTSHPARPPTPPQAAHPRPHADSFGKKPAAPPPRRHGHGRAEVKIPIQDDDAPRSSLESQRSRADSLRIASPPGSSAGPAPMPPPPRRPSGHNRAGSFVSLASPTQSESDRSPMGAAIGFPGLGIGPSSTPGSETTSLSGVGWASVSTGKDGMPKLSPPPPPPARHVSTRRPPSIRSVEVGDGATGPRKLSQAKDVAPGPVATAGGIAPPPPPPTRRQRGNSRASATSFEAGARRTSGEIERVAEEQDVSKGAPTAPSGHGDDILAELQSMQREVDALMGKYGSLPTAEDT